MSHEKFQRCIDACYEGAVACDHCASEDLKESDVKTLSNCISLDSECSAFCRAAAHVMSMRGKFAKELCDLCAKVCEACAEECEKHSQMEHCKECAEACRKCAEECKMMSKN